MRVGSMVAEGSVVFTATDGPFMDKIASSFGSSDDERRREVGSVIAEAKLILAESGVFDPSAEEGPGKDVLTLGGEQGRVVVEGIRRIPALSIIDSVMRPEIIE